MSYIHVSTIIHELLIHYTYLYFLCINLPLACSLFWNPFLFIQWPRNLQKNYTKKLALSQVISALALASRSDPLELCCDHYHNSLGQQKMLLEQPNLELKEIAPRLKLPLLSRSLLPQYVVCYTDTGGH